MAVFVASSFLVLVAMAMVGVTAEQDWDTAYATFYGDMSGAETMGGACGYGDLFEQGYGLQTAALSTALFNNGQTCGACFELQCYNSSQWCAPGTIQITATNFCPPNWTKPSDNGGWCNPPRKHFDLAMPMFVKIVKDYHAGIVPVQFRRIPCVKQGGIRFYMQGNPYWNLVLVFNIGGAGEVTSVSVKGSQTVWNRMTRNWGQNWQTGVQLVGQALCFRVMTSDENTVESDNIVPENWQFGQTFQSPQNF